MHLLDDDRPGAELAVGTGNNLVWQPTSTPGLVDATLNAQRIDLIVRVSDSGGNTGSPDGELQPVTLAYAPE